MSQPPDVTVVIPTRNRPVLLERAVRAVLSQTFTAWECLVVDDGSDPDARAALSRLQTDIGDPRVRWLTSARPGSGPSACRNIGIHDGAGEFVAFCDDDDFWRATDHLSVAVDTLRSNRADLYFANQQGENDGRVVIPDWFPGQWQLTRQTPVRDAPAVHPVRLTDLTAVMRHHYPHLNGCVVRRQAAAACGGFWEYLRFGEDVNFLLRLLDHGGQVLYRPDPVAAFNCGPRDSLFVNTPHVERSCQMLAGATQVLAGCRSTPVRRAARSLSAWHYRQLATHARATAGRSAGLSFAWRAWWVYPSAGSGRFLLRSLVGRS